jgi:vacuolar protein sorting-associated protein 35
MVAVGCLFIRAGGGTSRDILRDLVEMTKGVQHPTRGLFLRSYLCQRSRGLLPDTGSAYEGGAGGDIHDAVDFLLTNFIEMNKLWVRMQHQGPARDREKREKERQQLQDLVGRNLTLLSQLDGLSFELYASSVLPRLLEQVGGLGGGWAGRCGWWWGGDSTRTARTAPAGQPGGRPCAVLLPILRTHHHSPGCVVQG